MRSTLLATAALLSSLAAPAARATELEAAKPISIDLATFRGTAYYTPTKDGYRVVATLASVNSGSDQPPVIRLITTLNADQTVHLSVPGALGADGRETTIAFSRRGDRIDVASAD
ncbi:hypothetical protein [Methylobacterium gossipiicola]|uniref:Uncharacterized protein n=1 Tax=Methylobacterium gossipiicola TaxID=582675 RepID=A0A1I2RPN2_9HYPH|nr:hypothetical protein [Methylobacterium gossipiicola]SFG42410.1 hypothetical protein SAMN05192565_10351 [Methylobacterium gossipiicola]